MSLSTTININGTIIPSIPFIWYREQESSCPIDDISIISKNKIKEIYNIDINYEEIFMVTQKYLQNDNNLYICLHTLMYYMIHKNDENILTIDSNYNKNIIFEVETLILNNDFIEVNNGLKNNGKSNGCVFIHDGSFSPPGCFHFKIDKNRYDIYCMIRCLELGIDMGVLFVLLDC
jgi:hypothetical protein